MSAQHHALILAGGEGKRVGGEVPKQFLPVAGMPIIIRTIKAFLKAIPDINLIVVGASRWNDHYLDLANEWDLPKHHAVVTGGDTRFASVVNGLRALRAGASDGVVAVHDAVRPLVTEDLILRAFTEAEAFGSAVPVVEIRESVREVEGDVSSSFSRDRLRLVQTPQCFRLADLIKGYEQPHDPTFTDCATVMESAGYKIHLIEGERGNIKITTREDLEFAQWQLASEKVTP